MRNWLIRLLGGMPQEEAEFLRERLLRLDSALEHLLEIRRAIEFDLRQQNGPIARPEPVAGLNPTQAKQPFSTVSEPWTIRKRRLEAEDLRRVREEQNAKHEVGNGSNGPSETAFR